MDKRFRREKNISRSGAKKESSIVDKENKNLHEKKKDDVTPLEHISETYANIQSRSLVRDTLLLGCVLFVLLFCAGWAMPRVFSFHIDFSRIAQNLLPPQAVDGSKTQPIVETASDILILGRGGYENDAPDLTDSIIYGHYDGNEPQTFTGLSIPRDLLIQSKILGRVKINEVYSGMKNSVNEEAGFQHILETVSGIIGHEVKYYVMIDFVGFRKLIDQVGGIDIDVPERLYDNEYPTKGWGYTTVDIAAGIQHFDGDKALKYARSRHTTSDFDRSKRQQLIISALREKMLSMNILTSPTKIAGIIDIIKSSIKTNIPLPEMFSMAKNFSQIQKEDIIGHALDNTCFETLKLCHPGGLLYTPDREMFNGASVLLPKKATAANVSVYDQIRLFVQIFTTYPTLLKEFPLTIVNASGRTNLAQLIAVRLRSIGFPVDERQIRNQKDKVEKTFIRYNSLIIKPDNILLKALVSVFGLEAREATGDERMSMVGSYELVLGNDTSTYFK